MVDPTVKKETRLIAAWTAGLTVLMESIFLILRQWDLRVLFGGMLGAFFAVLNFFLMGLGIQKALTQEAGDAKNLMKLSQSLRLLMLGLVLVLAFSVPAFNPLAAVIPLFFPRIAILLRPLYDPDFRKNGENEPSLLDAEDAEDRPADPQNVMDPEETK